MSDEVWVQRKLAKLANDVDYIKIDLVTKVSKLESQVAGLNALVDMLGGKVYGLHQRVKILECEQGSSMSDIANGAIGGSGD
jgi:uncharacterized protein YunC (DUF1805 family)